ncbi:MAG: tetraacyldisaccharide 4'-kinase [Bacteroidota bacterium]
MNLANFTLQSFRFVLLPVSILYGLIIRMRNFCFDKKWLPSTSFNFPIICIGNLSVGGTGKSPMIEFLVRHLSPHYKITTLSRGYKRKTKGYLLANEQTTALEIGDEPMQFHLKFPDIHVSVCEKRVLAIPHILQDVPETELILLDDAFQHRAITPGFSILLTEQSDLFTRDFYLPTGNLRDEKSSYKRANIIIVTKCDENLNQEQKNKLIREIRPTAQQQIFFSSIEYGKPYHILNQNNIKVPDDNTDVLLVTGIANIHPLKKILQEQAHGYDQLSYGDHHIYTLDDMNEIESRYKKLKGDSRMILTTEKDAVRLVKFKQYLNDLPMYVLPIQHKILFNEANIFVDRVRSFVDSFEKKLS